MTSDRRPGAASGGCDVDVAVSLAAAAGNLLVRLRRESFDAGLPPDAVGARGDVEANRLLIDGLSRLRPGDAVLSEEAPDDPARLSAARVWIVDPLDGTREYGLAGREDWAVHVALWERDRGITAAAVGLPDLGTVLTGRGAGAVSGRHAGPIRTVVSESRPPAWLGALGEHLDLDVATVGSAGFKAMAVLRGSADAYLHSGGQYEWDSAAPVGVVMAAGLHASRLDGAPLLYNQPAPYLPDLMICRPELTQPLLSALRLAGAI